MKKIRLTQPYASLVVLGVLQTIPNIWHNVKYGEKVFIYADDLDNEFQVGLDFTKPLHRKIYNEIFLDNISEEDLPIHRFIGYVRVYHTGKVQEGWVKNQQVALFVTLPYQIRDFIEDFDVDDTLLENAKSHPALIKKIVRKNHQLFVPIGREIWQKMNDIEQCKYLCMFWEDYMEDFASLLFRNNDIEEISDIYFQYNKNTIHFLTGNGVEQSLINYNNTNEVLYILNFNLEYLCLNSGAIKELGVEDANNLDKKIEQLKNDEPQIAEEEVAYKKEYRPYIRFISTPMGGMTRWKR